MILIQAKHCQKSVETSQPPLNVLPIFIITEQKVLVQSVYVKRCSLLSLHLVRTLEQRHLDVVRQVSNCYDSVLLLSAIYCSAYPMGLKVFSVLFLQFSVVMLNAKGNHYI